MWERALEVSHTNATVWLKYAEMEMRHRFVNHARNVWDRAVSILPRVDQLWYKYIHMEEMLGNVPGARQIFERWMKWEPDHHGWAAFIKVRPAPWPQPAIGEAQPTLIFSASSFPTPEEEFKAVLFGPSIRMLVHMMSLKAPHF